MQLTLRTLLPWITAALGSVVACTSSSTVIDEPVPFVPPSTPPSLPPSSGGPPRSTDPQCPVEPPAAGSPCSGVVGTCSYGPDVRDDCQDTASCSNGRWVRYTRICLSVCPTTFAAIAPGSACPDTEMACSYEEGTCGCVEGSADADAGTDAGSDAGVRPGVWKCVPPPTTPFCPRARPHLTDACVHPVLCDYGSCALGRPLEYHCSGAFWQSPISSSCEEP